MVRFLIMMTCICAKLVSAAHANQFIKSHWIYVFAFLVLYLKTMSLSSLKIMKKSLITEYNDPRHQNLKTKQETWTHQTGDHVHVPCMIYHKNHPFFEICYCSGWTKGFPHGNNMLALKMLNHISLHGNHPMSSLCMYGSPTFNDLA